MDFEVDFALEDAIVGLDGEAVDVDVELLGEYGGDLQDDACVVDAFDAYGGWELDALVGVPAGSEDAVAVGHFQAVGNFALAFVDGDAVVLVIVAEDIVAGNGVTACAHDVVVDGFLVEDDGVFAVELCLCGGLQVGCLVGIVALEDVEIATPVCRFVFAKQVVDVGLSEGDASCADGGV